MNKNFTDKLKEIEQGLLQKTMTINGIDYYVDEKTAYSFHFYAVYYTEVRRKPTLIEFLYDLRNQEYFIKKNGTEILFNERNLDSIIPRAKINHYGMEYTRMKEDTNYFFSKVSVDENKDMYKTMIGVIGSLGLERANKPSRALIRLITEYSKLELLYKAGFNIAAINSSQLDIIRKADLEGVRKLHQIFGLTKSQFNFLKEYSTNDRDFFWNTKKARYLKQTDIDTFRGYRGYIKSLQEKYNIDDKFEEFFNGIGSLDRLLSAASDAGMDYFSFNFYEFVKSVNHPNPRRLIEYLLFECEVSQGIDSREALSFYKDYYNMCTEIDYKHFEKYPSYLKTYHDVVARNYKIVEDELIIKNFTEKTTSYKHYECELGDYTVVVPNVPQDLVIEGNILRHCVASYYKKVAKGHTKICFLRDKEQVDIPLVTFEITKNTISQAQGQCTRRLEDKEKAALKKFAKKYDLEVNYIGC